MAGTIQYDDSNLQRLFAEMDPKARLKAIKGAFRQAAKKVRKTAVSNLRYSIHSNKDLEKGIRSEVFKRNAGFRVTIGSKTIKTRYKGTKHHTARYHRVSRWTDYSYHTNRQGKERPILIWAEAGTKWRKSKRATRYLVGGKWRTGASRGAMKQYGFMRKTADDVRDTVTGDLQNELVDNVKKVAKKYGCA